MSERILIVGGPRTGKTHLARQLSETQAVRVRGTDETLSLTDEDGKPLDWSAQSLAVSEWFDEPGPWIIEGVVVPRALRKWRARNPDAAPPADRLIYLWQPREPLIKGQASMAKGVDTVLREILPWLTPIMSAKSLEHLRRT